MRQSRLECVAKSRRWRDEDAALVVRAWRDSGETVEEFSAGLGIQAQRVTRWDKALDARRGGEADQQAMVFHPVRVVKPVPAPDVAPPPTRGGCLAEVTRDGWTVRVAAGFDAAEIGRLLHVVAEVGRC